MVNNGGGHGKRSHFVLVHGAGHGAWCWYKLTALFESAGHKVTAMDLTGCSIDSRSIDEVKSVRDNVKPLMEVMTALLQDEKVVTNDNPQKETSSITPPADPSSCEQISHQGKGANKGKNKTVVVPSGRKKKDAACYGPIKVLRARRVEEKTQRQNENLSQHSTSALEAPEISTQQSITNAATGENFLKSVVSE
ncbi:hypothetical protein J5N97_020254 [Dioscorea zingiberensis]|uniref:AB hydrolase-1 domain-containing protein n=1 Tax=Dioscorea zingiberensis TaxID=325984 RepID=A0A9D5CHM5_9LILI|nr:hypothetical protein J5N97_020254 [Dioscorea zingiberensis]